MKIQAGQETGSGAEPNSEHGREAGEMVSLPLARMLSRGAKGEGGENRLQGGWHDGRGSRALVKIGQGWGGSVVFPDLLFRAIFKNSGAEIPLQLGCSPLLPRQGIKQGSSLGYKSVLEWV